MENSSKVNLEPENELKKWDVPLLTSISVSKTSSNFNDTIVDNETGSSGS